MKNKVYKKDEYSGKLDDDLVCPECKYPLSREILLSSLEGFDILRCGFCSRTYKVKYIVKSLEIAN